MSWVNKTISVQICDDCGLSAEDIRYKEMMETVQAVDSFPEPVIFHTTRLRKDYCNRCRDSAGEPHGLLG